jgi:hypothetical protein
LNSLFFIAPKNIYIDGDKVGTSWGQLTNRPQAEIPEVFKCHIFDIDVHLLYPLGDNARLTCRDLSVPLGTSAEELSLALTPPAPLFNPKST